VLHVAFDLKITRGFQYIGTLIRLATPDVLNWSGENDHRFNPLLSLAAQHGDVEVVRCLLRNGANVNRTDHRGFTAMHWAAFRHHIGVLVALGDKGDWNFPCHIFGVKYGYTPLHMVFWENPGLEKCAKPNYQECVNIIAGIHGANLNVVGSDECSPLTLALQILNPSASTPEDMLECIDVTRLPK
jgi:ankyrin repeat protein